MAKDSVNIGVIFAGGVGTRMNSKDCPKQFLRIHDKPIIIHTLEHFEKCEDVDHVVIACVEPWIPHLSDLIYKHRIEKVRKIVPGGETGQLSIYNGLRAAKEVAGNQKAIALIHDGVRPLINTRVLCDDIESVHKHGSAITVGVVKETILVVDEGGHIKQIPPRDFSRVAKAPQCFWLDDILAAHEKAMANGVNNAIDSCTIMQQFENVTLHMVDGPTENVKVTTPDDYYMVHAILDAKENAQIYGISDEN